MKTRTSLTLILTGILALTGSLKLSNYHIRKANQLKQSLPTRVYEIQDELSKLEGLPAIKILNEVSDPNGTKLIEHYRNLLQEWDSYDPNMIADVFKGREKYQDYQAMDGGIAATGMFLTALGLTPIVTPYLNARSKRKKH